MIISIVNKKGGTGKTTSTINLGRSLALYGKRILLIDMDPQGNLSFSLGVETDDCLLGKALVEGTIGNQHLYECEGMDVLPSTNDLINYEVEFIRQNYPYTLVKDLLESIKGQYDYIMIDCPPSVSYLTVNALIACDFVLIPMQMDVLSLQGLNQMIKTVEEIKDGYNPEMEIVGVLGVLVDERRQLTYDILDHVRNNYGLNIFNNYIRQNVKAAEAPSYGMSVIKYAPDSNSAKDYQRVAKELLTILEN